MLLDVPDPPMNVELVNCANRGATIRWQIANENNSPVTSYSIEYNTSFSPHTWRQHESRDYRARNGQKFKYDRVILSPWANYSMRIILSNSIGRSKASLPTQTWCRMPADRPRHHPRHVCTLNLRPNTLTIAWQVSLVFTLNLRLTHTRLPSACNDWYARHETTTSYKARCFMFACLPAHASGRAKR